MRVLYMSGMRQTRNPIEKFEPSSG
jgi:hypothetical protein